MMDQADHDRLIKVSQRWERLYREEHAQNEALYSDIHILRSQIIDLETEIGRGRREYCDLKADNDVFRAIVCKLAPHALGVAAADSSRFTADESALIVAAGQPVETELP